ncbi:MAG: hypothetical protein M3312_07000 [Actinomycetota bacterium]|nr:hypothetical protein [Actinomycetota bacterium]
MGGDLHLLLARIRELSQERTDLPPQPLLAEIEHTLTDGYARALALEGESWRIQKRIGELAAKIESSEQAGELRRLGERLARATGELAGLRASLEILRRRAEAVRGLRSDAAVR